MAVWGNTHKYDHTGRGALRDPLVDSWGSLGPGAWLGLWGRTYDMTDPGPPAAPTIAASQELGSFLPKFPATLS